MAETSGVEEAEGNAIVGEFFLVFVFDVELDGLLEVLFGLVKEIEGGRAIGYYGVADNVSFLDGFCDGEVADFSGDCLT